MNNPDPILSTAVRSAPSITDVSFGDLDYDLSSLFIDVGEEFTIDVARRYGHPDLQRLQEKLQYFDVADQIDTIVNGEGWALPGQREQLGTACADASPDLHV